MKKLIAISLIFSSCSYDSLAPRQVDNTRDIYISGSIFRRDVYGGTNACYWKNDNLVLLSGGEFSIANSLTVSGKDIYVAGTTTIDYSYATNLPVIWKNGQMKFLPIPDSLGSSFFSVTSILVNEQNVYVTGFVSTPHGNQVRAYWKDDQFTLLLQNEWPSSVVVKGNEIYLPSLTDGYYRNETLQKLPNCFSTTSLLISGNDIYAVGLGADKLGNAAAAYWKNDSIVYLQNGGSSDWAACCADIRSLAVDRNDVYVVGTYLNDDCGCHAGGVWKNGELIQVSPGLAPTGISVVDKKMYVSGIYNGGTYGMYWIDQKFQMLPHSYQANSIFIE